MRRRCAAGGVTAAFAGPVTMLSMSDAPPRITWLDDDGQPQGADWRSPAGHPAPMRVVVADEGLAADAAFRLVSQGTGLLWRGDYPQARQMLQALGRRLDRRQKRPSAPPATLAEAFHLQRQQQAERARLLGLLLLPFEADHSLPLARAADVRAAALQAQGPVPGHYVASLRELLGWVGAYEWRWRGLVVPALGGRIHPHYGVYSPVRGEYVDLVAQAPLPAAALALGAFDIGTGTGVLAALLAKRGLAVQASDVSPAALACAAANLQRLGLAKQVRLSLHDLFPAGQAGLVLCNPPWVPAPVHGALDAAVYDPDSRMLRGFLAGLAPHLAPGGEGWLILSDLAEHLGLRSRAELLGWIAAAGLCVLGRSDIRPQHRRATDPADALHAARAAELTSLWRLGRA